MPINPLTLNATHYILIGIGVLVGLYFVISSLPGKNQLHVRNIKTAKWMLKKINNTTSDNHAFTFGILRDLIHLFLKNYYYLLLNSTILPSVTIKDIRATMVWMELCLINKAINI